MGVVTLIDLCSGLASATACSLLLPRRVEMRLALVAGNCLGRNEFRSVDVLGSVEIGGAGRPRTITGAAANILTDPARYFSAQKDATQMISSCKYCLLTLNKVIDI